LNFLKFSIVPKGKFSPATSKFAFLLALKRYSGETQYAAPSSLFRVDCGIADEPALKNLFFFCRELDVRMLCFAAARTRLQNTSKA
jgi:hypothetical protein